MLVSWPTDKILPTHIWVSTLVELSMSRGATIEQLLKGTRIFVQDLTQLNHYVSAQQLHILINNCQKYTRSHDLSFMLGRRLLSANDSEFSTLLFNCRTLTGLFRILILYQAKIFPLAFIHVKRANNKHYILLNTSYNDEHQQFIYEVFCSLIYHCCKTMSAVQPVVHFQFEHSRPRNIYQYEENLGHRIQFNAHHNAIVFQSAELNARNIQASKLARQRLLVICRQTQQCDYNTGIKQFLHRAINRGDIVNFEQAAKRLDLSPATLKRRLSTAKLRFQHIHDNVKKQQAVFELVIRNKNNETVAKHLNYSDVTNFRRAFKRWTGYTPKEIKTT